MMKRILFVLAVTATALLVFSFVGHSGGDAHDGEEAHAEEAHAHDAEAGEESEDIPLTAKQMATVDLRMGTVEDRELDATLRTTGALVLRPSSMGDVTPLAGGIVRSVLVGEGQAVKRGQTVATIENTDIVSLQREYFTAYKECQLARLETERQQTLAGSGAGIRKNLQEATHRYQAAQASLTAIGQQLTQLGISVRSVAQGRFTTVMPLRAPVSGTVGEVTASLGSYADTQTPIMKIRDNAAVECDLNVYEKDIDKVNTGNRVLLRLTNRPDITLTGRIYGLNPYFNDGTRSIAVHVRLDPGQDRRLIDGTHVTALVSTGRQRHKALPDKAIVTADGKNYIFALTQKDRNGQYIFRRHEVTTGASGDGYTAVQLCKHIREGQQIVTANAYYLASLTGEHGEHNH